MASGLSNLNRIQAFSTSLILNGKRNFRKFKLYEKRQTMQFKKVMRYKIHPALEHTFWRGDRPIGIKNEKGYIKIIPEMIPDLIVPDLTNFELKPYVSYRVPDVNQSEFTPQDLFYAVYSKKIAEDFENSLLDEDGSPKNPSAEESITSEEAKLLAQQTGSDIYG